MISFIYSFEIITAVIANPKIFFWIAASVADAPVVNLNVIKALFANGFGTIFIKGNPVFSNGPKTLRRNLHDCPILCNWVVDNFILADETFSNALRRFETCLLIINYVEN